MTRSGGPVSPGRLVGLDAARGLAVLGMTWVHLVPVEGAGFGAWLARVLEGKAAALFFLLAGIAWRLEEHAHAGQPGFGVTRWRRVAGLAAMGLLLHFTIWPTQVLVPMALMLATSHLLRNWGHLAGATAFLATVGALVVPMFGADRVAGDWLESGAHRMDGGSLSAWLRGLMVTGNYPWVPWWVLVWAGGCWADGWLVGKPVSGLRAVCLGGVAFLGGLLLAAIGSQSRGPLSLMLTPGWVPTTVPFLLVILGFALAVTGLCAAWRNPPVVLAGLGRQSLSMYVGHLVLVCAVLRWVWPAEDWSAGVGMEAWFWWTTASALWVWWCVARGGQSGPLETLMAWISGKSR